MCPVACAPVVWSLLVKGQTFCQYWRSLWCHESPELSTLLLSCFERRNSCSEPEPGTQVLLSVSTALRASSLSCVLLYTSHLLSFSKSYTPTHARSVIFWRTRTFSGCIVILIQWLPTLSNHLRFWENLKERNKTWQMSARWWRCSTTHKWSGTSVCECDHTKSLECVIPLIPHQVAKDHDV